MFQGENYLDEAIKSARRQDYDDLEIVISDNASTDATPAIVARHASEDHRIKSIVQPRNIGAAANYNAVFHASTGAYFAWNAHDDWSSPDFIRSAVRALEGDAKAVLAVARLVRVDDEGTQSEPDPIPEDLFSDSVAARFRAAARARPPILVFGVFRRSVLETSSLHEGFTGSDRNLVAEVLLHGRLVTAGESRFYLREHQDRSVLKLTGEAETRFGHPREGWYAPDREGRIVFPGWRRFGGYVSAIRRTPLSAKEKTRCFVALLRLLTDDGFRLAKMMANDVLVAVVMAFRRLFQGAA